MHRRDDNTVYNYIYIYIQVCIYRAFAAVRFSPGTNHSYFAASNLLLTPTACSKLPAAHRDDFHRFPTKSFGSMDQALDAFVIVISQASKNALEAGPRC